MIFDRVTIAPLWLLALPTLAALLLEPPDRLGAAATRVIMVAFALGALELGAGGADPGAVARYAATGPDQALFVSLTLGMMVGAVAPLPLRRWRVWIGGMPLLLAVMLPTLSALRLLPLLLGLVLGAVPLLLGGALPRLAEAPTRLGTRAISWPLLAMAAGLALVPPLSVALLAPLATVVIGARAVARGDVPRHALLLPAIAALAAIALAVVAIRSSGDLLVRPAAIPLAVDLLAGTAPLAGALAMLMVLGLLAPWPCTGWGLGVSLLPAAIILAHRMVWTLVPVGMAGWAPLAALMLVPSAVIAAWRGRWPVALGTLAFLAVAGAGPVAQTGVALAVFTAVAVAWERQRAVAAPDDGVTFPLQRWIAACLALAVAGVMVAILRDEVVLGTVIAAGAAAAASRSTPRQRAT